MTHFGQMELTGISRTFHPETTEHTFFSSAHGTFSITDHLLGHKTNLRKFKIISSIFSDHNGRKLETNLQEEN